MQQLQSIIVVLLMGCAVAFSPGNASSADDRAVVDEILESAESFFTSLKNSDYSAAWDTLTQKSRDTIIRDVHEAAMDMGGTIAKRDIEANFRNRGIMFTNYWNSFVRSFDTDMILEQSQWEMGVVGEEKTEIIITYKKAAGPTALQMFRESGAWRVGLVETFWVSRASRVLKFIDMLDTI